MPVLNPRGSVSAGGFGNRNYEWTATGLNEICHMCPRREHLKRREPQKSVIPREMQYPLAFPPQLSTTHSNESLALSRLCLPLISLALALAFFARPLCVFFGFLLSSMLGSTLYRWPLSRRTHASSAAKQLKKGN